MVTLGTPGRGALAAPLSRDSDSPKMPAKLLMSDHLKMARRSCNTELSQEMSLCVDTARQMLSKQFYHSVITS